MRNKRSRLYSRCLATLIIFIMVFSSAISVMATDELNTSVGNDEVQTNEVQPASVQNEDKSVSESDNASTVEPLEEAEEATKDSNSSSATTLDFNSVSTSEKYIVSYVNEAGTTEYTKSYESGESVDLSLRLGGGEKQIGWALEKGGSTLDTYSMPAKDISLYPVLETRNAKYTVFFEVENSSTGSYDVKDKVTVQANSEIGKTVSADTVQESANAKKYDGYEYSSTDSTGAQTIVEDSDTEIHVRFKAKSYKINFDINGNYRSVSALYYASLKMEIDDNQYTGTQYSVTAKAGENIEDAWPTADNVVDNPWLSTKYSSYFKGWTDSNGNLYTSGSQLMDAFPSLADADGNVKLSAKWEGENVSDDAPDATIKYNIYFQNPTQDGYDFHETLEKTAKASALSTIKIDGYEGYTYKNSEPVGEKTDVKYGPWYSQTTVSYYPENNLYFDRITYNLKFVSNGETVETKNIPHGKSLSEYADFEPNNNPAGRSYFDGWYDEDGAKFDFNSSMPMKDLTLTASWKYHPLETKTLSYDANEGDGSLTDMTAATGSMVRVADSSEVSRDGYTFTEWNTVADGSGTSYSENDIMTLNEDTTLYAIWEKVEPVTPEEPEEPEEPGSAEITKKNVSETPKTGDSTDAAIYLMVMIMSMLALLGLTIRKKTIK